MRKQSVGPDSMKRPEARGGSFPYPSVNDFASYPPSSDIPPSGRISPSTSLYSMASESRKSTATGTPLTDDQDSIRVVVRMRPMISLEKQRADGQSTFCMEDRQTIQIQKMIDGKPVKPMTFHGVYDESFGQEQMFENCGIKSLVEKAIEGYNSTVFAYGQTGTGKTYTITGPDDVKFVVEDSDRWGIVPRCLRYTFALLSNPTFGARSTVYASYLEIYNEQVQDLLNPTNSSLPVRWNSEKGFYVENLFVVECEVLDDCLAVMEEGLRNRKVASHRLNEHSSRSHGIMAITIETEIVDPDDGRLIKRKGKITFVDLAGSEKIKESRAEGGTLTETLNINKSLLTLGNCISALADKKKKKGAVHVPYRDSKLTKLLSDSIGGNAIALMIACVSPATMNLNETINTLRYASRAKRIQNKPVIQMDPREELIANLKKELKAVKAENDSLKQTVMEMSMGKIDLNKSFDMKRTAPKLPTLPSSQKPLSTTGGESEGTNPMVTKIMEEHAQLQKKNDELKVLHQKTLNEKEELMKENERLINRMERLVQVFGSGDVHSQPPAEGASSPSALRNITTMKASRELKADLKKETTTPGPRQRLKTPPKAGESTQKPIDRPEDHRSPLPQSNAQQHKLDEKLASQPNNDALRKELNTLDKQINSLSKETQRGKLSK